MPDPLNIRILCSKCGSLLEGAPPCRHPVRREIQSGLPIEECGSVEFEAYLPLKHVPEEIIEQKRAELLEFNAKGGPRKLTEEETARMNAEAIPVEAIEIERFEDDGGPVLDEIPAELRDKGGFG